MYYVSPRSQSRVTCWPCVRQKLEECPAAPDLLVTDRQMMAEMLLKAIDDQKRILDQLSQRFQVVVSAADNLRMMLERKT